MKKVLAFLFILLLFAAAAFCQADSLELRIFKVKYGNSQAILEAAHNLKSNDGRVSFDAGSRSLIVYDYPQNLERIASVVSSLDVRERQVEIKVMVAEATSDLFTSIGVRPGTVVIPQARFRAVAKFLESSKDTRISTSMMVRTVSNRPAMIQVAADEVIGNEVVLYRDGREVITPLREPIGSFLEVLPSVNEDRTIKVILRPSLSSIDERGAPEQRTVLTEALINDGDTVVVGRLDSSSQGVEREQTALKTPLSRKASTQEKKIVMFLTAKIID